MTRIENVSIPIEELNDKSVKEVATYFLSKAVEFPDAKLVFWSEDDGYYGDPELKVYVKLEWERPETPEEEAARLRYEKAERKRKEKWAAEDAKQRELRDRREYLRLKEMFETRGLPDGVTIKSTK